MFSIATFKSLSTYNLLLICCEISDSYRDALQQLASVKTFSFELRTKHYENLLFSNQFRFRWPVKGKWDKSVKGHKRGRFPKIL